MSPFVSFIIPAHNEESSIVGTLRSIEESAGTLGLSFERIVVADACSDATVRLSQEAGASVVEVDFRQISATRHEGATRARGEVLFFVDGDTLVNPEVVAAALRAIDRGASGGGCLFQFDGRLTLATRWLQRAMQLLCRLAGLSGGCFLYCTAAAYQRCGGFDRSLFAAEEIAFALAIRRFGRFVVVPHCVTTSGRKLRAYGLIEIARALLRLTRLGRGALRSRQGLDIWYQRRDDPALHPGNR